MTSFQTKCNDTGYSYVKYINFLLISRAGICILLKIMHQFRRKCYVKCSSACASQQHASPTPFTS